MKPCAGAAAILSRMKAGESSADASIPNAFRETESAHLAQTATEAKSSVAET